MHLHQFSSGGLSHSIILGIGYACILDDQANDLLLDGHVYEHTITASDAEDVWDAVRKELIERHRSNPDRPMN